MRPHFTHGLAHSRGLFISVDHPVHAIGIHGRHSKHRHSKQGMSVSVRPELRDLPAMCHMSLFGKPDLIFMGVASPLRQCHAFEFISNMRATLPFALAATSCFRTENQHVPQTGKLNVANCNYNPHKVCMKGTFTCARGVTWSNRSSPLSLSLCLSLSLLF